MCVQHRVKISTSIIISIYSSSKNVFHVFFVVFLGSRELQSRLKSKYRVERVKTPTVSKIIELDK